MAMEQRQTQIKERAGLDESRLNKEFIDLMEKWGPHFLLALAAVAGLYYGYNWLQRQSAEKADAVMVELDAASAAGNPAGLERLAEDHPKLGASLAALTRAADAHLQAARTGVPIGVELKDNKLPDGVNYLTDEEKKKEVTRAEELFQKINSSADDSVGQSMLAIGAINGLASIAEDRGELDKARGFYEKSQAKAAALGFDHLADAIKKRIGNLDKLKNPPKLYANADLPSGNKEVAPVFAPMGGGFTATTADGQKIPINVSPTQGQPGTLNLTPTPPPAPAPTPAPGPAPAPSGTSPAPAPTGGTPAPAPSKP